ncbi:hypothetical protein [Haloactinopolyspora alba]|uniref:hypothetical protein n=1 Tax=Haloactinopolyspora alba TaxID=648780 RepID=UPI00197AA5DE|nr:hypothetical protein [Haloactinopolyspora alba]
MTCAPTRPPDLHATLAHGQQQGCSHVGLDGKIVDTDRVAGTTTSRKGATIDAWYSGKTRDFSGQHPGPHPL